MSAYDADAPPGVYEYRGIDCEAHGANVPGYRPYKGVGQYSCVTCANVQTLDQPASVQPRKVAGDDDTSFWAL